MKINEAIEKLKEGKYVREQEWPNGRHLRMMTSEEDGEKFIAVYDLISLPFLYSMDILTKDDKWKIYRSNAEEMNFFEALKFMENGSRMQLSQWNDDIWIEFERQTKDLILRKMEKLEWIPTVRCLLSNNWRLFEW